MTDKDKLTIKWLIIAAVMLIAVAVMYHFNKPLKEVQENKIEYSTYRMY